MAEFSSSPEARALARLKEWHRAEQAPPDFRTRVAGRLAQLEAPSPKKRTLSRRGGIGLLLLAAAATVTLAVRSDRMHVTPLPEQPKALHTAESHNHAWDLKAGRMAASGNLAPNAIRAVLRNELGHFRECYETLPQPRPVVAAKLSFRIGAAGNVTTAHVDSEASPALGQCLERVLLPIQFPAPQGGDVEVDYPMQFGP